MSYFKTIKFISIFLCSIFVSTFVHGKNQKDTAQYIVRGIVFDEVTKEVLPGATVMLNKKIVTITKYDGSFSLRIPDKYSKKKFTIYIKYPGYDNKVIHINHKKETFNSPLNIYLKEALIDMSQAVFIR